MKIDRVVLDSSLVISAGISPAGKPAQIVRYALENLVVVYSDESFDELSTRLLDGKHDGRISQEARVDFLNAIYRLADWVVIEQLRYGCADVDDEKILETAVKGKVQVLVTSDKKHMLPMRKIGGDQVAQSWDDAKWDHGVVIVNAAEFMALSGL